MDWSRVLPINFTTWHHATANCVEYTYGTWLEDFGVFKKGMTFSNLHLFKEEQEVFELGKPSQKFVIVDDTAYPDNPELVQRLQDTMRAGIPLNEKEVEFLKSQGKGGRIPDYRGILDGYHKRVIARGTYGEWSKVVEESQELLDALEQENAVLAIVECTDWLGAVRAWLLRHRLTLDDISGPLYRSAPMSEQRLKRAAANCASANGYFITRVSRCGILLKNILEYVSKYNLNLSDLLRMEDATQRAFRSGQRTAKHGPIITLDQGASEPTRTAPKSA